MPPTSGAPTRQAVSTDRAPAAIGPYSQAVRAGNLLFLSGQIALDPVTGALVAGGIDIQTRQVFANISVLLAAAGGTLANVVKTTVYLADMAEFAAMNNVYGQFFSAPYPARATVAVAGLPRQALVEIDVIAVL